MLREVNCRASKRNRRHSVIAGIPGAGRMGLLGTHFRIPNSAFRIPMFRLIDRYLLGELLSAVLWTVAVLTFVLVLGNVFKQVFPLLVSHNLPISYIVAFVSYLLPFSLTFTIPWGMLTAVLLVFGRWSASNELTALRTLGVPLSRITVPVFVLAIALCGVCLWINLEVAPRAQENMRTSFYQIATTDPIALFDSDQVITDFQIGRAHV